MPLDLRSDDLALRPWDRGEVHRLFDTLQFRVLRDRLYQTLEAAVPGGRPGIRCRHRAPRAGRAGPLARHPHRAGSGRRVGPRLLGSGHGARLRRSPGHGRGAAAWFDPSALDPADDAAFAAWLDDPDRPEGPPRRQGTAARAGGPRVDSSGVGERHRAVRLRGAAGQRSYDLADLVLLPAVVSCAPRTEEPESSSSPSTVATRPGSARARQSGHVRCSTSPGFSTTSSKTRRTAPARRGGASTRRRPRRWNGPESPSTSTSSSRSSRRSATR